MRIKSRDYTYEVIERLADVGEVAHYRCRCVEEEQQYHAARFSGRHSLEEIPLVADLAQNASFTDLKEYFVEQESVYLIFSQPQGESLAGCLERDEAGEWDLAGRFGAGQRILERIILLQMPEWLTEEVLAPELIFPMQDPVGFYYPLSVLSGGGEPDWGRVCTRMGALFAVLFERDTESGLYPEIEAYLKQLGEEKPRDMMEAYRLYLELMPVCGEKRMAPVKEKKPLRERLRDAKKKILTAAKLAMGAAVVVTALTAIPKLWKEKIQPVAEAAALWKAVYVDGETLEPEKETETETAAEADPENGQVAWRWENGNLCYKGAVADGVYEGRGTLYYPDGNVEYQGDFSFGKKEGEGSQYTEEGILLYEGGFHRDKYEGAGKLYDGENGNLIYDGEFSGGKYSGAGVLFDPWSEFPVYDGTFRQGYYDGQGVEYDNNGAPRYEGEFLLGVYHGTGIYYDAATGLVMMEGEFRNGNLVTPAQTQDAAPATESDAQEWTEGGQGNERTEFPVVVPEAG